MTVSSDEHSDDILLSCCESSLTLPGSTGVRGREALCWYGSVMRRRSAGEAQPEDDLSSGEYLEKQRERDVR